MPYFANLVEFHTIYNLIQTKKFKYYDTSFLKDDSVSWIESGTAKTK